MKDLKDLKKYSLLLISIVVILFLFLFFTRQKIEEISQGTKILAEDKEKLAVLTNKQATLSSLDETNLTDQLNKLNFILPNEKSTTNLIFTLDRFSSEASVSMKNLSFSPGQIQGKKVDASKFNNLNQAPVDQNSIDVSLEIEGSLKNLRAFFDKLKSSNLAVKITKLLIEESLDNITTATVALQVYYKSVPMTLGDIATPLTPLTGKEQKLITEISAMTLPVETNEIPPINEGRLNPFLAQ